MTERQSITIEGIPAILWGKPSQKIYIHIHGKHSRKEYAEGFAQIAEEKGFQTISFDLPEHGERTDSTYRCDVWNGVRDLNIIADFQGGAGSHFLPAVWAHIFRFPPLTADSLKNACFSHP